MYPGKDPNTVALNRHDEVDVFKKFGVLEADVEYSVPLELSPEQTHAGVQELIDRGAIDAAFAMRTAAMQGGLLKAFDETVDELHEGLE